MEFDTQESTALALDQSDPLSSLRNSFHIPAAPSGQKMIYMLGNSLGLQPKKARDQVNQELDQWASLGVEGHFRGSNPWFSYTESFSEPLARIVGAKPEEVITMGTLTANLHFMMASFYRPTAKRFKILVESGSFPSDRYAVCSQIKFHGYDTKKALIELKPRKGQYAVLEEDILDVIKKEGSKIALVLLGNVNYLTGQAFNIGAITRAARAKGCCVGFDLAHGAGNLPLDLHKAGPDFAVWCSYKYLNGGPGAVAGAFVHSRHARSKKLPRLAGWWGHHKERRFKMEPEFSPMIGAAGWAVSNPPILSMAPLKSSLELFERAGFDNLRRKSEMLTSYGEYLVKEILGDRVIQLTPQAPVERGAQISLKVRGKGKELISELNSQGVICDFREPHIIRFAPVPLYNTFLDVFRFVKILDGLC